MKPESKKANAKGGKKGKPIKKKKKKDPNEPPKPISAYALFFKDTQISIKGQNPRATFGEVSKIVASMWESLDLETKTVYKDTADAAKKEYAKALAAYRATLEPDPIDGIESPEHIPENTIEVLEINSSPPAPSPTPRSSSPEIIEERVQDPPVHNSLSPTKPVPDIPENEMNHSKTETNDSSIETISPEEEEIFVEKPETEIKPIENKSPERLPSPVHSVAPTKNEQASNEQNEQNISNGIPEAEEKVNICLRSGCNNPAIDSLEWDKEYCSNECVVEHCNTVFLAHVAARQQKAGLVET